jgi:hypothetical protein
MAERDLKAIGERQIGEIVSRVRANIPAALFLHAFIHLDRTLAAVCEICPLDLARLLTADEDNFWHDIAGIVEHFDLATKTFRLAFAPRFARQTSA